MPSNMRNHFIFNNIRILFIFVSLPYDKSIAVLTLFQENEYKYFEIRDKCASLYKL